MAPAVNAFQTKKDHKKKLWYRPSQLYIRRLLTGFQKRWCGKIAVTRESELVELQVQWRASRTSTGHSQLECAGVQCTNVLTLGALRGLGRSRMEGRIGL